MSLVNISFHVIIFQPVEWVHMNYTWYMIYTRTQESKAKATNLIADNFRILILMQSHIYNWHKGKILTLMDNQLW